MRFRRRQFWAALAGAFLMPLSHPSDEDIAAKSGERLSAQSERIAFESNRDGNWEIYTVDANGDNPVNFSRNDADDLNPAWSPISMGREPK